jgi:hypothetical protein
MSESEEPTIKVAHLWMSVASVIVSIALSAGGVIWSIATFKSETSSALIGVRESMSEIKGQLGEVSRVTQDNRDWIMRRTGAEEAEERERARRGRGNPVFSSPGESVR